MKCYLVSNITFAIIHNILHIFVFLFITLCVWVIHTEIIYVYFGYLRRKFVSDVAMIVGLITQVVCWNILVANEKLVEIQWIKK